MTLANRTVHASGHSWEVVRYEPSGHWFAEWTGFVGPASLVNLGLHVNRNGRARIYAKHFGPVVAALALSPHYGRRGGSTFDYLVRRTLERKETP